MIKTKQLIPNPNYDVFDQNSTKFVWRFVDVDRQYRIGDVVSFSCNGRGRGGHYNVTARITKVNKKTFKATELVRSYRPGTPWTVNYSGEDSRICVDLSWRE